MPGARDVVTGEAVALELRLAKVPSRALALILDLALLAIPLIGVAVLAGVIGSNTDDAAAAAIGLGSGVLVVLGYPIAFETLNGGRTPGKLALGLRVVRDDGGPIRFRHALTRALVGVVVDFDPIALGSIALISSLCSTRGKRVGDHLAGTVVIRERIPVSVAPPAHMPPHLAGWAATLPVDRIPNDLALQARQVLGRLGEFDPRMAAQWTTQLAGEVMATLGQPAPSGVDPVTLLAAVLAERRNRELARAGWVPQQAYPQPPAYPQPYPTYPAPTPPTTPPQPDPGQSAQPGYPQAPYGQPADPAPSYAAPSPYQPSPAPTAFPAAPPPGSQPPPLPPAEPLPDDPPAPPPAGPFSLPG
jgi:uncharacterized RDD family membrane protein YckC